MLDVNELRQRARLLPARRSYDVTPTATGWRLRPKTPSAAASTRCGSRTSRPAQIAARHDRPNTSGDVVWAADDQTFFYVEQRPGHAARLQGPPARARHRSGARPGRLGGEGPQLLHRHRRAASRDRYLRHLLAEHGFDREPRSLPADRPDGEFRRLPAARARPRVRDRGPRRPLRRPHQLAGEELPPDERAGRRDRRPRGLERVVPHRDDVFIDDFEAFRDYVAIAERSGGLQRLRIKPLGRRASRALRRVRRGRLRRRASASTPSRTRRACATSTPRSPRRTRSTTSTCDRRAHAAQAAAGARRLRRRELRHRPVCVAGARRRAGAGLAPLPQGRAPRRHARRCSSTAYGSYGCVDRPDFDSDSLLARRPRLRLSRSPTCAAARRWAGAWYEDGKLLKKKNTFTDFIDVTEALVARKLRGARPGLRHAAAAPAAC